MSEKVFTVDSKIKVESIRFKNRYGIEVAGDLYLPENYETKKNPAIAVSGPFGGVKEQASGLYAHEMAKRGIVAVAFDQSFTGESGGEVRNVASPEIFTEDFSAAVDYLGLLDYVDRNRIGLIGICGLTGMALTAASGDSRIKAVATVSMYDMSRSISRGYRDSYTTEQRNQIRDFVSNQRWVDAQKGEYKYGPHEISFDPEGNMMTELGGLPSIPEEMVPQMGPVVEAFYNYYVKRAYHENSINSTGCWTQTTPMSFFEFDLMSHVDEIAPRAVMLVAGENAHSRYYSEDVYEKLNSPKELVIVPNADHVDLYDQLDKIPFDKIQGFFEENLK